jgi:DNA-binding transcriptional LysR family regulator
VRARLLLLDRPVGLVEEGIDIGLRFAHLPDSALIAVRVGEVRRVLCAAPAYLDSRPPLAALSDLADHRLIALEQQGRESWSFAPAQPGGPPRIVQINPQLSIIGVEGVVDAAADGFGIARLYSSHVAALVRAGRLRILLPEAEPPPLPVHLITPEGRLALPKVRAFFDFAVPRLRRALAELTLER